MVLTRLAVVLATSLADWTNCLLATGLEVLEEARRQALQRAEVCLATIVAADRTLWTDKQQTSNKFRNVGNSGISKGISNRPTITSNHMRFVVYLSPTKTTKLCSYLIC